MFTAGTNEGNKIPPNIKMASFADFVFLNFNFTIKTITD